MSSETEIIATIGPSSRDREIISKMIDAGMDVARLNFSWGTRAGHMEAINLIREIAKNKGVRIPIIQDLSGPRKTDEVGHHFDKDSSTGITEKDIDDLTFGISMEVEYVALSYVGSSSDILALRKIIADKGGKAKIIAKIERKIALENADSITASADALMIARGDLGNEIPLEKIPFVQEELISIANRHRKPVIVATGMMSSMIKGETPSRADITDVAMAVLEHADAVMLSDETAIGEHPVEVVVMMEKILREAELRKGKRAVNIF